MAAWQHPASAEEPGSEATFAEHVLHAKVDSNFRKLRRALQQNTEMDSSAERVWDTFEVVEDVQSQAPDASKELERIGDRLLHLPENGEALLAP